MGLIKATLLFSIAAFVLEPTVARADQPPWSEWHFDRHEPWSWSPMVGAAVGGGDDGASFTLDAALRFRYGRPPGDNHGDPRPRLAGFGAVVSSTNTDTVEPALFLGFHLLPDNWSMWSQEAYLNLRADLGTGFAVARDDDRSGAFAFVKVAVGVLLARRVKYLMPRGAEGDLSYTKDRFRTELDLVVKTQVGAGGVWHVTVGIEVDPLRVVSDAWRLVRGR